VIELKEKFLGHFGKEPRLFRAPGRVNLIGEHTDYNGGFVMPAALDFATWVALAPRPDHLLVMRSENLDEQVEFSLDDERPSEHHHWSDYVRGVVVALRRQGVAVQGADLMIWGNVPIGSGLSSSASLEVAACLALGGEHLERPLVASLCQQAENEFVGMRCGIMDQYISACAVKHHALLLDCRSLEAEAVPVPPDLKLVICNSGVRHSLAGGEYNQRRAACEEGARLLGVEWLRDARLEQVEQLPLELQARCRHVISENRRAEQGGEALKSGDLALFGRLMYESHASLRDDYQVSCAELNQLVELARPLPGVYGARMTGGGFGGCTINLVAASHCDQVVAALRAGYERGEIYVCAAAPGAGVVE
jgi:galactokinase